MIVGFQARAPETSNIHSRGYYNPTLNRSNKSKLKHQHCIHRLVVQNGVGTQNHCILSS